MTSFNRRRIAFNYRISRLLSFCMLPLHSKTNYKVPTAIKRFECINGNSESIECKSDHYARLQLIADNAVERMLNRQTCI